MNAKLLILAIVTIQLGVGFVDRAIARKFEEEPSAAIGEDSEIEADEEVTESIDYEEDNDSVVEPVGQNSNGCIDDDITDAEEVGDRDKDIQKLSGVKLRSKVQVDWPRINFLCGKFWGRHLDKRKIAGGYEAQDNQFPAYALLITEDSSHIYFCGGTLITDQHVLTAAHCKTSPGKTKVRFTHHNYFTEKGRSVKAVEISETCTSSDWTGDESGSSSNDFSILRLESPVNFTSKLFPACLPLVPPTPSTQVYAVGLGAIRIERNLRLETEKLRVLPVKQMVCPSDALDKSKICFKSNHKSFVGDTCEGDSGGPLFAWPNRRLTIYGVTSYGPDVCQAGSDTYSVNVDVFNMAREIRNLTLRC